jgi:hypothetical protein
LPLVSHRWDLAPPSWVSVEHRGYIPGVPRLTSLRSRVGRVRRTAVQESQGERVIRGEEYVGEYILLGVLGLLEKISEVLPGYIPDRPALPGGPALSPPSCPSSGNRGLWAKTGARPLLRHPPRLGPHYQITGWHALDLVQSSYGALSIHRTSQGMPLSLGG